MPINGYNSLCKERQKIIKSKDKKRPQKHIAKNVNNNRVTHYRVDGVIIRNAKACDFLLMNEDTKTAYLIELKGGEISDAVDQLKQTENSLRDELAGYKLQFRIVMKKCKTQQIENASTKKILASWRKKKQFRKEECVLKEDI